MAALSNNVHHHSFNGNSNNSMVRKHRTMQRRRQYQQRVMTWWIKLTIPPLLLWLIYYFGTGRSWRHNNNHYHDDKKKKHNDKGNDATKKKKSSSSGSTIALWMQQEEEEKRTGDAVTSSTSSSAHCIANIVDSIAATEDGKSGGPLDVGRDEAATILQQSLACFIPPPSPVVVNVDEEEESSTQTTTTTRTTVTSIRSVWIAGSTAAAGYGNQKHQSYPALLLQAWSSSLLSSSPHSSNASGNAVVAVDVGRDATEFPLAWCRRNKGDASAAGRNSRHHNTDDQKKKTMALYDYQDDVHHFNTTRLRDFVDYVRPTVLIMRLSNDHDISSQREIVQYLSSLVVGAVAAQEPEHEPSNSGGSLSTTSVRAVYVIDVSSSLLNNNDDNNGAVAAAAAVFGVAHSPDRLHPHHLTVAQHKRVAQIVRWLMRYHGFYDSHQDDDDESIALQDNEPLDGSSSNGDTASFWHCASGFGDATTTGRTAGSLHFVAMDEQQKNNIRNSITLATVLPNCCGNSMDSVLLPNQDLRHLHWMWDALDASAKRRDLPFDQYGHTDWKIVVSGTPSSGALKVVLPVAPNASSSSAATGVRTIAVSHVRVCGECDGMIVSSSAASSGVDADGDEATTYSLHPIGYGCFDITPPAAAFFISVLSGTCQISHILWQ